MGSLGPAVFDSLTHDHLPLPSTFRTGMGAPNARGYSILDEYTTGLGGEESAKWTMVH
jgi:hypothetical protein